MIRSYSYECEHIKKAMSSSPELPFELYTYPWHKDKDFFNTSLSHILEWVMVCEFRINQYKENKKVNGKVLPVVRE